MSKDIGGLLTAVLAGGVSGFAEGTLNQIRSETEFLRKEGLARLERDYDLDVREREHELALSRLDIENTRDNQRQKRADERADERANRSDKNAMDRLKYETAHRAPTQPAAEVQTLEWIKANYGQEGVDSYLESKRKGGRKTDQELQKMGAETYDKLYPRNKFGELPEGAPKFEDWYEREFLKKEEEKKQDMMLGHEPGLVQGVMKNTSMPAKAPDAAGGEQSAAPSKVYGELMDKYVQAPSDKARQEVINEAAKVLPKEEQKRFADDAKVAYALALKIDEKMGGAATTPPPSAQPAPIGKPENMDQVLGRSSEPTRTGVQKFLQNGISLGDVIGAVTRTGVSGVQGGYDLASGLLGGEEDDELNLIEE